VVACDRERARARAGGRDGVAGRARARALELSDALRDVDDRGGGLSAEELVDDAVIAKAVEPSSPDPPDPPLQPATVWPSAADNAKAPKPRKAVSIRMLTPVPRP